MKLVKTASGQSIQLSYRDWKTIGERTGWAVEAAEPSRWEMQAVRPEIDSEEAAAAALIPLERRLRSYDNLPPDHGLDPRVVMMIMRRDLRDVLVATDESLAVLPNGAVRGDETAALRRFLTTPPASTGSNIARLKSVARQIARMTGMMGALDPNPLVPRTIRQMKGGLENIRRAPGPFGRERQAQVMSTLLLLLTRMFPQKLHAPSPTAPLDHLEDLLRKYLASPPDAHPREAEIQKLVEEMLNELLRKAASSSVALLKFASGAMRISKEQWMRIGKRRGWIDRLAEEKRPFKVAVDFDGTIAEHAEFPEIGDPVPDAFLWLKRFKKWGDRIFLWTMRSGDELEQAIEYCREHGLEFDAINEDPEQSDWTDSPKAYANIYIDDLSAGCPLLEQGRDRPCVDWTAVGPMVARMRKNHK